MTYSDKTLTCRDCGTQFTFTSGEQEFYASRGLANEPSRCPACRAAYKQTRGGSTGYSDRGSRAMYDVTCSACGRQTQVPFEPRGDRPVYCSDCFRSRRPERSGNRGYGRY